MAKVLLLIWFIIVISLQTVYFALAEDFLDENLRRVDEEEESDVAKTLNDEIWPAELLVDIEGGDDYDDYDDDDDDGSDSEGYDEMMKKDATGHAKSKAGWWTLLPLFVRVGDAKVKKSKNTK